MAARKKSTTPRGVVEPRKVSGSKELHTIEADSPVWHPDAQFPPKLPGSEEPVWGGAFLRARPPEGVSDAQIAKVKAGLLAQGAVAVRVLPRPKTKVILTAAGQRIEMDAQGKLTVRELPAREVVTQLVDAANTRNRDALRSLVEKTMAEVSL